jgi:hypothetical protein
MSERTSGSSSGSAIDAVLRLGLAALETYRRNVGEAAASRLIVAGIVGVCAVGAAFCLSAAAFTWLAARMPPTEAWAVLGTFYALAGGLVYVLASVRRRGLGR